jgi:hypothetical protein
MAAKKVKLLESENIKCLLMEKKETLFLLEISAIHLL